MTAWPVRHLSRTPSLFTARTHALRAVHATHPQPHTGLTHMTASRTRTHTRKHARMQAHMHARTHTGQTVNPSRLSFGDAGDDPEEAAEGTGTPPLGATECLELR